MSSNSRLRRFSGALLTLSLNSFLTGDLALFSRPLIVVDVETTGIDPANDAVVQIAACKLDAAGHLQEPPFMTYVRPERPISATAHAIHGLSLHDLQMAPPVAEAIHAFDAYARPDAVLCGHNIAFDAAFLRAAYTSAGKAYPFDYHMLDVWSISFFILGTQGVHLRSHTLSALCELYGIPRGQKHDALEDVRATASILHHMLAAVRQPPLGTGPTR